MGKRLTQNISSAYLEAMNRLNSKKARRRIVAYVESYDDVLFMDEPEVSLHIEWQKQLLNIIMQLNPNVQVILTTHSPAVIMDGWTDKVTEVNEIEVK